MADSDPIAFTRGAAQRIANAVREVEVGSRRPGGIEWDTQQPAAAFRLKLATFTGNWDVGSFATVTLHGSTQTASVYNWCNPALGGNTESSTESRFVIFGKVSGTNSAVEIQMKATQCSDSLTLGSVDLRSLPNFDASVIQLLGHGEIDDSSTCSGGLQWYSITTCSTATAS